MSNPFHTPCPNALRKRSTTDENVQHNDTKLNSNFHRWVESKLAVHGGYSDRLTDLLGYCFNESFRSEIEGTWTELFYLS